MAKLVHIEHGQVKAACAQFERLLAKDSDGKKEISERNRFEKAEKARRDKEFAATQPKKRRAKGRARK
jgi:hypothetical protein